MASFMQNALNYTIGVVNINSNVIVIRDSVEASELVLAVRDIAQSLSVFGGNPAFKHSKCAALGLAAFLKLHLFGDRG